MQKTTTEQPNMHTTNTIAWIKRRIFTPLVYLLWKLGNLINPYRNTAPIVISGSPRGGTTWIAESVAQLCKSTRVLWEPLNPKNPAIRNKGFSQRPYMNETTENKVQRDFFKKLLKGDLVNVYMFRLGLAVRNKQLKKLINNERLIIKFVRGNGVAGYLHRRFGIPKPLVVIRHPCAVVASQMAVGFPDHPQIDSEIIRNHPAIKNVINRDTSLEERQAMTWAADVLAAKLNQKDLHIVYYEDCVVDPEKALSGVLKSWGMGINYDIDFKAVFSTASSTSQEWSDLSSEKRKLERWKENLDADTVKRILKVASDMGVNDYDESSMPIYSKVLK